MKWKISSILLTAVMLLSFLPAGALAADNSCGSGLTWELTADGRLTISKTDSGGSGAMADYTTLAPAPWYDRKDSITAVIIGDGVTSIGESAFEYCSSLANVTIPGSVTTIGESAFAHCTSLAGAVIPNSVTSIGTAAFGHCSSLESIDIPANVSSMGYAVFESSGLKSATICNGVTAIADRTFQWRSALTTVTIPKSVTSIKEGAFVSSGLTTVYYGGSQEDWKKINIDELDSSNIRLKNAVVNYDHDSSLEITFDVNGGSAMTPNTMRTDESGCLTALPAAPVRSGYIFDGWYTAAGVKVTVGTKFTVNTTVFARWSLTVTFDTQGGSAVSPVKVADGGRAAMPAEPTKAGFSFGGWYKESACVNAWNFAGDAVMADVTLYARWTVVSVPSPSGGETSSAPSVTVPVSGEGNTVNVNVRVSGSAATVSRISAAQIRNVIGSSSRSGMVEIDFTGLNKSICTARLPAAAIEELAEKARNEVIEGLTVKFSKGEVSLDANALSAVQPQAGSYLELTLAQAKPSGLTPRQREAAGDSPVFDLTIKGGGIITDFQGGCAAVSLPYTLAAGQNPAKNAVYHLDDAGAITPCPTKYDVEGKSVIFTTDRLSLYFVGHILPAWENPYSDVAVDAWCYEAVQFVSENDLMGGFGDGRFGSNGKLSRAQFVQILYNGEGEPFAAGGSAFTDVADSAWCASAVAWAAANGIANGYGDGRFDPNGNITREQLAVMLWRYAGKPAAAERELHFNDAGMAGGYALEALCWAVESGIVSGRGGGILDPQGLATRGQAAQMVKNYFQK